MAEDANAKHVIVGAGPVGRETARLLANRGDDVVIVSRRGTRAPHDRVQAVALDAADVDALSRLTEGAQTIHMCAMAAYDRWPSDFPPIMEGAARAAERAGARLLVVGNCYVYGEGAPSLLTPDLPLRPTSVKGRVRAAMWERALASSAPALEVRAGDYLGEGAASLFTLGVLPRVLAGEPVAIVGDPDTPHPWTFTRDVARTLVAAIDYRDAWDRAFHAPAQTATTREVAARFAAVAGAPAPDLREMTPDELRVLGQADPIMREVEEVAYLQHRSFLLDASETAAVLGVAGASLDDMVRDTLGRRAS